MKTWFWRFLISSFIIKVSIEGCLGVSRGLVASGSLERQWSHDKNAIEWRHAEELAILQFSRIITYWIYESNRIFISQIKEDKFCSDSKVMFEGKQFESPSDESQSSHLQLMITWSSSSKTMVQLKVGSSTDGVTLAFAIHMGPILLTRTFAIMALVIRRLSPSALQIQLSHQM